MFKLLQNSRFFQLLFKIDCRQAQEAAQSCCRACGGKLHRADYPRKARGVPHKLTEQWDRRYSFCCSTEGCRLRHTPVSVRFLGRKVYAGVFVVLISALMNGPNKRRACELHRELGLDVRTLKRWHQWWQKEFVSTPFWRLERSGFMPPVDESQLPNSLLQRFGSDSCRPRRLVDMMKFLAALTSQWGLEGLAM
ncbi:MAG: hypothetical protein ACOX52_07410 [Verrucomicrobiota bacterium]|jgi:hypothetical protein